MDTSGRVGTAFILSYSGFILLDRSDPFIAQVFHFGDHRLEIQSPLRLANPTWRPIPQLFDHNISRVICGAPEGMSTLRLSATPEISADGSAGIALYFTDEALIEELPADTLIVLAYGPSLPNSGLSSAITTTDSLFEWIRVLTRQWWAGRPGEALTGNAQLAFPLIGPYHLQGTPEPLVKQTAPSSGTIRLNSSIWCQAADRIRAGERPTASQLFFSDASYFLFVGEARSGIVILCSAIELARDNVFDRKKLSKTKFIRGSDLLKHVSSGLEQAVGRSLLKEQPGLYDFLKTLWICRGHLAHGQLPVWRENDREVSFPENPGVTILEKAREAIWWLDSI